MSNTSVPDVTFWGPDRHHKQPDDEQQHAQAPSTAAVTAPSADRDDELPDDN